VRDLGKRNLSENPVMMARTTGENFAALDRFLSPLALRQFRAIFDPQNLIVLPPIPWAAKQIAITRLAMLAPSGLSRMWGVHRYQTLLRRPGYARVCRMMLEIEAVEDYDLISRPR
jgi:hypothetical protein